MHVFARLELTRHVATRGDNALLLEGAWDESVQGRASSSLDDTIGHGYAWIDEEAARLAETAAEAGAGRGAPTLAWLNVLKLRYLCLKLLRVAAYFVDIAPPGAIEFIGQRDRDLDYAALLATIARAQGRAFSSRFFDGPATVKVAPSRRFDWTRAIAATWERCWPARGDVTGAVALMGNPRVLDPVCGELARRGRAVWSIDTRYPIRHALRWRGTSVRHVALDREHGNRESRIDGAIPRGLEWRGISLDEAVGQWLTRLAQDVLITQRAWLASLESFFERHHVAALVLDEDATPLKRAAIHASRRRGVPSIVAQHGALAVRFGYSPLEADLFAAWDEASRDQLVDWGVEAEKIIVTGSPNQAMLGAELAARGARRPRDRVLLLGTVPPNDARPDSVAFRLTTTTYRGMETVVERAMSAAPGARWTLRPHPRAASFERLTARRGSRTAPRLAIDREKSLARSLAGADCVVSCASSAGIEAAKAGLPVVQLLPAGSSEVLPARRHGLVGSARSSDELAALVKLALCQGTTTRSESVSNLRDSCAARRIVEAVFELRARRVTPSMRTEPARVGRSA